MAYAAVIFETHTIYRLITNPEIKRSVYEELELLKDVVPTEMDDSCRSIAFGAEIRDAIWKLEDVLQSSYSYQYQPSHGLKEIDSFLKTVKKLREEFLRDLQILQSQKHNPLPAAAVEEDEDEEEDGKESLITVGLSDQFEKIIKQLLNVEAYNKIVSLHGMAGIGKTHLATQIYHHQDIVKHFELRAWVVVGQKYQRYNILVDIVAQLLNKPRDVFKEENEDTLEQLIKETLHGQRYLIVLDDIWGTDVLYCIKYLLSDSSTEGSRLLLTSRLQSLRRMPYRVGSFSHLMPFLNSEDSWNLLWQNVFGPEESFPLKLEKAGRKIAENCEGLPLLILTVANILRGLDKTEEYWEMVAEKKTTTFPDAYEQIYEVLLLSYDYLPQHIRPLFLYMGVFTQSSEIILSKLINLWVAEGFLWESPLRKTESVGIKHMETLVDHSVAIICKKRLATDRKIKSCRLHSAYWYLCVKEARKNNFFHVLIKLADVSIERPRRLSVQNNILFGIQEVHDSMAATTSTTRSLLFTGDDHQYPVRICLNLMLLMRVLDALSIRFYEFPGEVVKLLKLRYLSLTHNGELPCSISNLQQLQYLILRRHHNVIQFPTTCLPDEIWDMQELRHVRIMGSNLPDPSEGVQLPNLVKLYVNDHSCTERVFRSIPNLNKLVVTIELRPNNIVATTETLKWLEHIGVLVGLESLKCVVVNPRQLVVSPRLQDELSNLPRSLNKLSLKGLGYSWKDMTAIASLPALRVLKLRCYAFQGPEWETETGQFPYLNSLLLEDIDLVHWRAQNSECFRKLRHLVIRHCYKLKMIPLELGSKQPHLHLKTMEVDECLPSVVDSAHQIKEKMHSYKFQPEINSSWNLP